MTKSQIKPIVGPGTVILIEDEDVKAALNSLGTQMNAIDNECVRLALNNYNCSKNMWATIRGLHPEITDFECGYNQERGAIVVFRRKRETER